MIEKSPLAPKRVRKIIGSFAFIEHRFLRDRFWESLSRHELLLYFFLILVADRKGLSYYGFDKICSLLGLRLDQYLEARDALIEKDLIAFDGQLFQVLSLPEKPATTTPRPLQPGPDMDENDPAAIRHQMIRSLGENND